MSNHRQNDRDLTLDFDPDWREGPVQLVISQGIVVVNLHGLAVAAYPAKDKGAMHLAVVALAEARTVQAKEIAQAFGISPAHLSRLRGDFRKRGAAGVVAGRPGPKEAWRVTPEVVARISELRAQGVAQYDIASRVGVSTATVSRILTAQAIQPIQLTLEETLDQQDPVEGKALASEKPVSTVADAVGQAGVTATQAAGAAGTEQFPSPIAEASAAPDGAACLPAEPVAVEYAGAMMLHPILREFGLVEVFEAAGATIGPSRFFDLPGTLGVLALGFGVGLPCVEGHKLVVRSDLGLAAGLPWAPEVRTLRRKISELAESTCSVSVTRDLARKFLEFEPAWDSLYFADGHFICYEGELPVSKGWDSASKRAARGRTDTYVHDSLGRPLFYLAGEVNDHLTAMIPRILKEILAVTDENADVQLFFDRGGFSHDLFAFLVEQNVGFATYLKGKPTGYAPPEDEAFKTRWCVVQGKRQAFELAEAELALGPNVYRLVVLKKGTKKIAIVTNIWDEPAAKIVYKLKLRWRQENSFKDLVENRAIDGITEYGGDEEPDPTLIRNPRRLELQARLAETQNERVALEARLGMEALSAPREGTPGSTGVSLSSESEREQWQALRAREQELQEMVNALPARLPRNQTNPDAVRAILRTQRRNLINGVKIAVHNAEHWLARRFQAYLKDANEYRMIFRHLLRQSGEIHYQADLGRVRVSLRPPDSPRIAAAARQLINELNERNPQTLDGRWSIRFEMAC